MSTYEIRCPATGVLVGTYANEPVEKLTSAMDEARMAQQIWAKLSFKERAAKIQKIKKFLSSNMERAVEVISTATGKTRQDALATEVMPCILACDWYANNTASALKPQKLPSGSVLFFNKSNTLVYEPVGVVGIISPWNYPFSIPFGEVMMGLMAGNAILLKVASNMSSVGEFVNECIAAGSLPSGLFRHLLLPGSQCGPAMLAAGVNKLFFTGSVRVGKQLMAEAAKTLTPLSLELGGNDAMVVLKDASLERAVNCACWAGFQNAGQSCGGVERVYVHESVYEEFLSQLCDKTRALRHGPDTGSFDVDMGSMTTKSQYDTVMAHIKEAVELGATIAAQSQPIGDCSQGLFIPATVLRDCTPEMLVMREETFGPVLAVAPFKDEDEAVRLSNACSLALTSSVFSSSKANAMRVAHRLESGVVSINDHLYSHGMSEAPWGGWKESGLGRTHGYLGLKEMCNVKCINNDCFPTHRNLWWYPFSRDTYRTIAATARFVAPLSCCERIRSLFTILGHASFMLKKWVVPRSPSTAPHAAPKLEFFSLDQLAPVGGSRQVNVAHSLLFLYLRSSSSPGVLSESEGAGEWSLILLPILCEFRLFVLFCVIYLFFLLS
eukprot:gene11075-7706_t